jgi:hypothetical protein
MLGEARPALVGRRLTNTCAAAYAKTLHRSNLMLLWSRRTMHAVHHDAATDPTVGLQGALPHPAGGCMLLLLPAAAGQPDAGRGSGLRYVPQARA